MNVDIYHEFCYCRSILIWRVFLQRKMQSIPQPLVQKLPAVSFLYPSHSSGEMITFYQQSSTFNFMDFLKILSCIQIFFNNFFTCCRTINDLPAPTTPCSRTLHPPSNETKPTHSSPQEGADTQSRQENENLSEVSTHPIQT